MEIAGAAVEGSIGVSVNGGNCGDRRRGGRFNRRRRIPIEVTNQSTFNDAYISSLSFTDSGNYSPVYFNSSVESWGLIHPYNHTPSLPISEEVDLESGEVEAKVQYSSENGGKQCRICHLNFEGGDDEDDDDDVAGEGNDDAMELGCDCKGDLATVHQKCALTWFLMKGDLKCEICGSIVQNVGGLLAQNVDLVNNEVDDEVVVQPPESSMAEPLSELNENGSSSCMMHGRRFVNVMLGCMAFAFVISWLFHFNMLH